MAAGEALQRAPRIAGQTPVDLIQVHQKLVRIGFGPRGECHRPIEIDHHPGAGPTFPET